MQHLKTLLGLSLTLCLLAFAPAAVAAPISAGNTGWSWANPLPQGNSMLRVAGSDGRVWAGGATGTLIHSDDGGSSWSAARTGLLDDIRVVEAISRDSVVFGGSCALRRSDDAGVTVRRLAWGATDDNCAAKILQVEFPTSASGYLLLSNGDIHVTSDGGQSWRKQGVAPTGAAAEPLGEMYFDAQGRGLLSVGNRILQSLDAGASWTPLLSGNGGGLHHFEFVSPSYGYALGDHGDLLVTENGGFTWAAVGGSGAGGANADGATRANSYSALSCASRDICIAAISGGTGFLRTTDGGLHWSGVATGADTAAVLLPSGLGVAVGTAGAIARSVDGGATWSRGDARALGRFNEVRVESKNVALAFGEDGVLARSIDGGSSWRSINTPERGPLTDAVSRGEKVLAVGTSGELWTSDDAGASWRLTDTGSGAKTRALAAFKGGRVLLVGPRGVRVSTRWGAGSKAARGPVSRLTLSSVDQAGSALFVHGSKYLAVTTDRGKTFKRLRLPRGAGSISELEMLSARHGYLLDSKAEVYATGDGAKTWQRIETTGANTASSLAFGDTKNGYIADATGRVLATSDAGKTWARQYPFFDAAAGAPVLLAGTTQRGALALVRGSATIFRTSTGGRIGRSSKLTIKPASSRVRKGTIVAVTGRLSGATGVERVAVLARVANARGGTQWVTQNVTVSPTGNFSTKWKITYPTMFIARWSGDAARDGDAAPLTRVRLRR